jgi:hypothetical protein
MSTVVALFAEEGVATKVAEQLLQSGIPAGAVHVHRQGNAPRNASGVTVDEYATGGFFTNFVGLLDDLLGTHRQPGEARSYADVVRFEGAAVSVQGTYEEANRATELLRAAGARKLLRS